MAGTAESPFRVGVYRTAKQAAAAIEALLSAGFQRDEMAVVCPDNCNLRFEGIPHPVAESGHPPEHIGIGGMAGAVLGGIVLAAATIASGGTGLGPGAALLDSGAITAAFTGPVPHHVTVEELGPYYGQAVRLGGVLVAVGVHGDDGEARLARAERILGEHGSEPTPSLEA